MMIVAVDCLGSCGIEYWAREKLGGMASEIENGNGSCDGRYLRPGWMVTDSRAQAGYLRSRVKDCDMRVWRLVVGSSDPGDQ